jgi:hypothetical protein
MAGLTGLRDALCSSSHVQNVEIQSTDKEAAGPKKGIKECKKKVHGKGFKPPR